MNIQTDIGQDAKFTREDMMEVFIGPQVEKFVEPGFKEAFAELKLDCIIGQGGQATVYKKLWKGLPVIQKEFYNDSEYAHELSLLKFVLLCNISDSATRKYAHPHIVKILGNFEKPSPSLILEFAPHLSLYHVLFEAKEKQPFDFFLVCVKELSCVMEFLHENDVLHRDLKSANILVFSIHQDDPVHIKVSDLGAARTIDRTMTAGVGTLDWMAPEVLESNHYDKKCDVWSFGIVMWEILKSFSHTASREERLPLHHIFSSLNKLDTNALRTKLWGGNKPPIPSPLPNGCPTEYRDCLNNCLEFYPDNRPTFFSISRLKWLNDSHFSSDAKLRRDIKYDKVQIEEETVRADPIGSGRYGDVYKAKVNDEVVVVKKLREGFPKGQEDIVKKFKRETHRLRSLCHNNVVKYGGCCLEKEPLLLVMEYVPRGSFFSLLHKANSEIPTELLWSRHGAQIALGTAYGLRYLHECKIAHCDLRSPNILISADWQAKLSDMGLSRSLEVMSSSSGCANINFRWKAPECFDKRWKTDAYTLEQADIFSFGVVVWEILAQQIPFNGLKEQEVEDVYNKCHRLKIPEGTSEEVIAAINGCWKACNRDSMKKICNILEVENEKVKKINGGVVSLCKLEK